MKYVYIGKNELVFGKIGEVEFDTFGHCRFTIPNGGIYYLEDDAYLVEADCFIKKCNEWLSDRVLLWENNKNFSTEPSVYREVSFDENIDEAIFWTVDNTWSKAVDSHGSTWIICYKTKTEAYAQRLDSFLRDKFYTENEGEHHGV
ncbi:MAG TPA: hypothetical protein DCW90_13830 [Lachnospiraceae bacterium]|nr:hypothetical protein [Lachnospiraceae bacterium]